METCEQKKEKISFKTTFRCVRHNPEICIATVSVQPIHHYGPYAM